METRARPDSASAHSSSLVSGNGNCAFRKSTSARPRTAIGETLRRKPNSEARRCKGVLGLARAMKAAMLRQVHESHPEAESMGAGNGEMNAAMRSIDARAGFKPHRDLVEYQAGRGALDLWSSRWTRRELFTT